MDAQIPLSIADTDTRHTPKTVFRVAVPPGITISPAIVWAASADDIRDWWRLAAGQRASLYELRVRFENAPGLRGIDHADFSCPSQIHPRGFQWIVPWPNEG